VKLIFPNIELRLDVAARSGFVNLHLLVRPDVCTSFPHLEQPHFASRLIDMIDNVAICPIAFNAFEKLKVKLASDAPGMGVGGQT
jgi:hypothetical protein